MVSIEKTARTVEEAIQLALEELGLPRERVTVEVLEEGRPLFGILGPAQARVRVTAQATAGERAAQLLGEMLEHMEIAATPKVLREDDSEAVIDIQGTDLGLLIGKHGQTLAAVQHLLGLMVNKGQETRKRIILDAEGYRERREESLRHMALAAARRAKQSGQPVTLEPLLPHERRIIHTTLAEDPAVTTRSTGDEPARRVVVEPRPGHEQPGQPSASARGMRFRARGQREGFRPRREGRPGSYGRARAPQREDLAPPPSPEEQLPPEEQPPAAEEEPPQP